MIEHLTTGDTILWPFDDHCCHNYKASCARPG